MSILKISCVVADKAITTTHLAIGITSKSIASVVTTGASGTRSLTYQSRIRSCEEKGR
jgi:hypothetical protein